MNKLCEICDTRNRLGMCNGRDGDFKYCFRKVGSTNGLFLKHLNWKMKHMV